MTIRTLPAALSGRPHGEFRPHFSQQALSRWDQGIRAAATESDEDRTISVYDVIGHDYWTGEGVTAKRIAGALRSLGKGPVTVNINSPGGDMFEGLAIYNLLREHPGEVTTKVLGLAASAASIIGMAGDTRQIARAGFYMVHNCWVLAIGNRHDMRDVADTLEPFDDSMADIYAASTGGDIKAMHKLMDAETWIGGASAIDQGFADEFLPSDQVEKSKEKASAHSARRMEAALRASGMPAAEAKRLISEFKSSARDAAGPGERDATDPGREAVRLQGEPLPRLSFNLNP